MDENPYRTGRDGVYEATAPSAEPPRTSLGAYVLTFVIMDLAFAGIRGLLLVMAVAFAAGGMVEEPMKATVPYEIASHAALFFFGALANIMILLKKPVGVTLGWVLVVLALLSFAVAIPQVAIQVDNAVNHAQEIGIWIGAIFTLLVRIGLLVAYVIALVIAGRRIGAGRPRDETMPGVVVD